jgi:hypothetical protein
MWDERGGKGRGLIALGKRRGLEIGKNPLWDNLSRRRYVKG